MDVDAQTALLQPEIEQPGIQNQTELEEPSTMPKRNDKYFLDEDPMAVFQVEDQLFKVHQYHLAKESKHFREMFAKSSEALPIHLPGVTAAEFENLLDYFYAPRVVRSIQGSLDLLSISHKFQVYEALKCAKVELDASLILLDSALTPLQKLVLGDQYGFQDWASSALNKFLEREESLSVEEAMALGFDRLSGFVKTREEQLQGKIPKVIPQNFDVKQRRKTRQRWDDVFGTSY